MKKYKTLAVIHLFSGKIELTDDQARRRTGYLSKIKDDIYEVNQEIVFKAGEIIGLEDVPKFLESLLEDLTPKPEPAKQPEPEERPKAKAPVKKKGRSVKKIKG
jgi:hypothetical protein